jgi:hypothetical protein
VTLWPLLFIENFWLLPDREKTEVCSLSKVRDSWDRALGWKPHPDLNLQTTEQFLKYLSLTPCMIGHVRLQIISGDYTEIIKNKLAGLQALVVSTILTFIPRTVKQHKPNAIQARISSPVSSVLCCCHPRWKFKHGFHKNSSFVVNICYLYARPWQNHILHLTFGSLNSLTLLCPDRNSLSVYWY